MDRSDPKGYYAMLGVAPKAPQAVIRAAYKALAMELHPDRNLTPDATRRFQELQRAYDVLGDPVGRQAYDASATMPTGPDAEAATTEQPRRYEPVRCMRCSAVTASPRFRVFYRVYGYLLGATRRPVQGVWCRSCETKEGLLSTGITTLAGWWSIHGFVWTVASLYENLFGAGRWEYAEINARLLAQQVTYFLSVGNIPLAVAVGREALVHASAALKPRTFAQKKRAQLGYGEDDSLRQLHDHLTEFIKTTPGSDSMPSLAQGLGVLGPALYAQATLLGSVALALGAWIWWDHSQEVRAEQVRLEREQIEAKRAAAIAANERAALEAMREALPASGEYPETPWTSYERNLPRLRVHASAGSNSLVRLVNVVTSRATQQMFVRAGETADMYVLPGTYRVKIATGQDWYGEKVRFGPKTSYSVVPDPLTFSINERTLEGHEIDLHIMSNGNLHLKQLSASEF